MQAGQVIRRPRLFRKKNKKRRIPCTSATKEQVPVRERQDRLVSHINTQMIIILSDIGHSGAEQEVRRDWVQAVGRASPQRSNFAASFQMFLPIVAVSAMLLKPRMITCRCTLLHPVHEMHRRSPVDDALVQRQ